MNIKCEKVLATGIKFIHEYDFDSTTELLLEVLGHLKVETYKKNNLLIQNEEPAFECSACNEKAEFIDSSDYDMEDCYLCKTCVGDEDEGFLHHLVNSPRTGVCGYG